MRTLARLLFLVLGAFIATPCAFIRAESASAGPSSSVFKTLEINEIRPASIQIESLLADHPSGRPVIDNSDYSLWMSGKKYIWSWNLRSGHVARLALPAGLAGSFRIIAITRAYISGVDSRGVLMFDRVRKTWRHLDGRFDGACIPKFLNPLHIDEIHRQYLVTECGVFLALYNSGQLVSSVGGVFAVSDQTMPVSAALMAGPEVQGPEGRGFILAATGRDLIKIDIDGPKIQTERIYTAKSLIRGVSLSGNLALAWTSQALIVFDRTLTRRQVVPVLGTRKIRAFGAGPRYHMINFTDGAVELMDMSGKIKWAAPGFDSLAQYIDFTPDESLVVLSSDSGPPRVFSMANLR